MWEAPGLLCLGLEGSVRKCHEGSDLFGENSHWGEKKPADRESRQEAMGRRRLIGYWRTVLGSMMAAE